MCKISKFKMKESTKKIISNSIGEFFIIWAAVLLGIHIKSFGVIEGILTNVYGSLLFILALIVAGIVIKSRFFR